MNDQENSSKQRIAELERRIAELENQLACSKEAETALRESEHLQRAILDNIPDPAWVKSPDGRFAAVNRAWCLFTGSTHDQVIGRSDSELFPPEVATRLQEQDRTVAETGQTHRYGETLTDREGRVLTFETFKVPLMDLSGRVTAIIGIARDTTERTKMERELREGRARLEQLAAHSRTVTWEVDSAGLFTYVSPAVESLLGYSPAELVGRLHFYDLHPDAEREAFRREAIAFFERRESFVDFINPVLSKEGRLRWYSTNGLPVLGPDGTLRGYRGSDTDITERQEAIILLRHVKQDLQESEERLQSVLEGSRLGTWDWNVETGEVSRNEYWAEMLGYSLREVDDATSAGWLSLIHPEDRELAWRSIEDNLAGRTTAHEVEYRMLARDGSYRWILDRARVVRRDREGRATRMSGTHQDVTERKRMEESLRESEERYRNLIMNSPDAIFVNQQDRLTLVNHACIRLFGANDAEQLLGKSPYELFDPEFHEVMRQRIHRLRGGSEVAPRLEERIVRLDGTRLDVEVVGAAFQAGGVHTIHVILRDISVRKQAELELRRHRDGLEEMVRERTVALRENEEKFRVLFEGTRDAILLFDDAGCICDCNSSALTMYGYASKPDLLRHRILDLSPKRQPNGRDSQDIFLEYMQAIVAGDNHLLEWQSQKADGTEFPVEVPVTPLEIQGRRLFHGAVRDVSERKRTEATLRKLSHAVEYSPSMILITDPEGRVDYVNPTWERVTGYRLEEVRGQKPHAMRSGVHSREFYSHLWSEITAGKVWRGEFCNRRKNGELYWESAAIAPVHNDTGEITHYVGVKEDITQRREMEEQLRQWNLELERRVTERTAELAASQDRVVESLARVTQSEEKFRAMFEQAPLGVALIDSQTGRIHEANPRFAEIAGLAREEMITSDWMSTTHPEDIQPDLDNMARLNAGEIAGFQMKKRYVRPDDSVVWVNMTIAPMTVKAGLGPSHLCMIEDITEHKQMESERRQWADAFAHCAHGIALGNPGTNRIVACNAAMARMLGKPLEQIAGSPILSLYAPEDRDGVRSCIAEADRVGQVRYESHMVRSDGAIFPVQMDVVSVCGDDGVPAYRVATAQDISERQRAEIALRGAEMRRNLALEAAKAGTWEWSLDTGENVWSRELWQVYGLPPNSVEPSYEAWRQTLHPEDRYRTERALQEIVRQEAELNLEWRVVDANGGVRWLMSRGRPVRDSNGRVTSYLGVVIDVTDLKEMEQIVVQRTREVAEANARLAVLDQAKTDFLRLISHELRTPMNGMFGIAELMFDMVADSPKALKYSNLYHQSRQRIMTLIEDALLLCEISAGIDGDEQVPCELAFLLQQARQGTDVLAQTRRVKLAPVPDCLDLAVGVPRLLVRALQSLMETAVKFARAGSVVGLAIQPTPGGIGLIIEAEGRCIPPEVLPRFFQLLAIVQTLTNEGDLGLAPALAERIVTLYGGTVTVENLDPPGIRFTVRLRTPGDEDGDAIRPSDL